MRDSGSGPTLSLLAHDRQLDAGIALTTGSKIAQRKIPFLSLALDASTVDHYFFAPLSYASTIDNWSFAPRFEGHDILVVMSAQGDERNPNELPPLKIRFYLRTSYWVVVCRQRAFRRRASNMGIENLWVSL